MENIPLSSIKFPGLTDKYTMPKVDANLATSGAAADAKKTGDELTALKADLSQMKTATSEDVGKALKAKTVSGGKVTEWEFGEAGGGIDPSDIEQLQEDVTELQTGLSQVSSEIIAEGTDLAVYATANGWALTGTGASVSNSNSKLVKYQVIAGNTLRINLSKDNAGVYQWQKSASVPTGSPFPDLVGDPVTVAVNKPVTVPEGARFLIVSQFIANTTNVVKNAVDRISSLESEVTEIPTIKALVGKTAEERMIYHGNVVDTTGKTAPGTSLDGSIHFILPDGEYYSNPWSTETGKSIVIAPKDAYGNAIYLTRTGTGERFSYREFVAIWVFKIIIDGLNVRTLIYLDQTSYEAGFPYYDYAFVLDSKPAYWTFSGSGYTQGSAIERGFTQTEYNTEYVPFAEPGTAYAYTDELNKHINGYSEDVKNMLFEPSMNLLDYSKIVWVLYGNLYNLEKGYYMPVVEETTIVTNNEHGRFRFYDSSYTEISSFGYTVRYSPVSVPVGAMWARVEFYPQTLSEGDPVMVWQAKSETSAPFERPIFRPSIQYKPDYFDGNLFDYAVPTKLDQGVMRWARFVAFRAMNEGRDAYRFGTFNTFVSRGSQGFPVIREMLFNYGIDFCGFQECNVAGTTIGAAMYDFQFPYNSGARFETDAVPTVSRFEVMSVNTIALTDGNHYCKVTKMNLPQNKHYPRVPTLSVYNYHGSLALANRLAEIQTMLGLIANDTSDFIVIMGDTNSEVDSAGHRQSWDAWEAAGFTAVHHGESPTWPATENPSRYSSTDNIFVSEHINVLHYDIIDGLYLKLEDGTTTLSDHDFVFADLQFDFDAVLKDTW